MKYTEIKVTEKIKPFNEYFMFLCIQWCNGLEIDPSMFSCQSKRGHIVSDKVFASNSNCWAKEFVMESAVGSKIGTLNVTVAPSFGESLQLFL